MATMNLYLNRYLNIAGAAENAPRDGTREVNQYFEEVILFL